MYSLWFLPAALLAAPKYSVWPIKGSGEHELRGGMPSVPEPFSQPLIEPAYSASPTRVTRWIPINEFVKVLTHRSNLLEINLRKSALAIPFSELTAPIPLMDQNEPYPGLEWTSEKMTSSSWYASDFVFLPLEVSSWMDGSSPLHLLEGDLSFGEVA